MNNTDYWDKALADADDPDALEPHDFDDSAAWADLFREDSVDVPH